MSENEEQATTDIENKLKKLETKFKMLDIKSKECKRILERSKRAEIEKHIKEIQRRIDETHDIKGKVQECKIEIGASEEEVETWTVDIESRLESYDEPIEMLQNALKEIDRNSLLENRKEQDMLEEIKKKKRYDDEKEIEVMRLKLRQDFEKEQKRKEESEPKNIQVKLPKLMISKFEGTHLDWQRFWGQFENEIDNTEMSQVSKFNYLKEMLKPKVRTLIDSLPFTTEGYERAKNILKSKYGKETEVANAHIQSLLSLPTVQGTNPYKINQFYEKFITHVQALDTMGKLKEVKGYVRLTLEKLPGIKADIARTDDTWQDWDFNALSKELSKWIDRNYMTTDSKQEPKKDQFLQAKQRTPKGCVYCGCTEHKSKDCDKIKTVNDRKKVLKDKRLCFNCTGSEHRAGDCKSKTLCFICKRKHHTSICDKQGNLMLAAGNTVIHPVVVVKVNNITCRALLDTGSGSSYASATLLQKINVKPTHKVTKRIEMMMSSTTKNLDVFDLEISDMSNTFKLHTSVYKVDKSMLLTLPNPRYNKITTDYPHLHDIAMNDSDTKDNLPVHLILGASDYARVKMQEIPRIGNQGEPIAEKTRFGWVIMSPGSETEITNLLFSQSSEVDFERLCNLDAMGIADIKESDNNYSMHVNFKEQLKQNESGWYETGLIYKREEINLPSNENGSIGRLNSLLHKLERSPDLYEKYDQIIKEQYNEGIVEKVDKSSMPNKPEFYMPHKAVIRENAESTKIRVVYDASARASYDSNSLNDCLESGPNLQNMIWDILVRTRFYPVALCGDLKQAFLQIRIKENFRDALRFHWVKDINSKEIDILRFTRLVFGLTQSPFILEAIIQHHLEKYLAIYENTIEKLMKDLYVDDLITGEENENKASKLKDIAKEVFKDAGFTLHKWHSNLRELEEQETATIDTDQTYAKQQLGVRSDETKMLGIGWNKRDDHLFIEIPKATEKVTKRNVLHKLASIYDVLGLHSPCTLIGKSIFRKICETKVGWDQELPTSIILEWRKWEKTLPSIYEVPRAIPRYKEELSEIDLHLFSDASLIGTSAVAYAVIKQPSGISQGLIASKSRLSKKNTTIPRLELNAAVLLANLAENLSRTMQKFNIKNVYGWSDSLVVLHWIKGKGDYKQYVTNRVKLIKSKDQILWRYVNTTQNPADLASRGCNGNKLDKTWINGPEWLQSKDRWPEEKEILASKESEKEAKLIKAISLVITETDNIIDTILSKCEYWKSVRIVAWIKRFTHNARKITKLTGPLKTEETNDAIIVIIKREQFKFEESDQFKSDKQELNLVKNDHQIYECRGRISEDFPVYIPRGGELARKIIHHFHKRTLHGGVILTMTALRERYWIPRLRQQTKNIIKGCYGCKRFQAKPYNHPPPGQLTKLRTSGERPFQVIGLDFAGPIMYKKGIAKENKSYILLFTCSLSRAIHLELLPNQTTKEFIRAFKRLIARRGIPEVIFSDNAKTFIAAHKWIKVLNQSEELHQYFAVNTIKWKFNLSRAPWWGGQFERMVGLVKNCLYKTVGKALLSWYELEDVLLDIENNLNNRPLSYVEDEISFPILTPNVLILGQYISLPNQNEHTEEKDVRKRYKYVQKCKNDAWERWRKEYVKSLRERHNMKFTGQKKLAMVGDVVIIHGDEKNRGKWTLGIISEVFPGPDGVVRAVRVKTGKSYLERAVQHLYPLELSCDKSTIASSAEVTRKQRTQTLNPEAKEFRRRRDAAAVADVKIRDVIEVENSEPVVE